VTSRSGSGFARALALAVFVAALLLVARGARAADPSAKTFFESGVRHYNLGHFPEAIAEFEKAYNVDPAPILLFNIAQSHRQLGDKERALFFYRRYLEQAPNAANKGEVEQRMKDLKESLQQERDLKQKPPPGVETKDPVAVTPPPPPPPLNPPPDDGGGITKPGPPPVEAAHPWAAEGFLAPGFITFSGSEVSAPVMFAFRAGLSYAVVSGASGPSTLRIGADGLAAILPYTNVASNAKESSSLWGFMLTARYLFQATPAFGLGAGVGVGVIWWGGLADGNPFTVQHVAASGPIPMPSFQAGLRAEYALGRAFLALSPELTFSKTTSDGLTKSVTGVRRIDIYAGVGVRF
jgi:tetratricopeptide (TPR) repeat protein